MATGILRTSGPADLSMGILRTEAADRVRKIPTCRKYLYLFHTFIEQARVVLKYLPVIYVLFLLIKLAT